MGYAERSEKISSRGNPACLIWKKVMSQIHEGLEDKSFFSRPDGIISVTVCADCGKLANASCGSRVVSGEIQASGKPTEYCSCHVEVKVCTDPETGEVHLANEYCPEETVTTQVMFSGREYLTLGSGRVIGANDNANHLTWLELQGPCPLHDENFVPDNPDEPDNPDDPNPPDDPDNPGNPDNPGEGGGDTPGSGDTPGGGDASGGTTEPQIPSVPDEPAG